MHGYNVQTAYTQTNASTLTKGTAAPLWHNCLVQTCAAFITKNPQNTLYPTCITYWKHSTHSNSPSQNKINSVLLIGTQSAQ